MQDQRDNELDRGIDLLVIPLTAGQAINYVYNVRQSSEDEIFWFETFMRPKLETLEREKQYFYTFWIGIDRSLQKIATEFVFKGEPDNEGSVEFGFHTGVDFEGRGYMTVMMACMIQAAKSLAGVKKLTAISENPAAIRVLEKFDFKLIDNLYTKIL